MISRKSILKQLSEQNKARPETWVSFEETSVDHTQDNSFNVPTQPAEILLNKSGEDAQKRVFTEHSNYIRKRKTMNLTTFATRGSVGMGFNLPEKINTRQSVIDKNLNLSIHNFKRFTTFRAKTPDQKHQKIDELFAKEHENIISNIDINYSKIREQINDQNPYLFRPKQKKEIVPKETIKFQPSPNLITNSEKFGKEMKRRLIQMKSLNPEPAEFSSGKREEPSLELNTDIRATLSAIKKRHDKTEPSDFLFSNLNKLPSKNHSKEKILFSRIHRQEIGSRDIYGVNFRDYQNMVAFGAKEFKDYWNPENIELAHDMYMLTVKETKSLSIKDRNSDTVKNSTKFPTKPKFAPKTSLLLKPQRSDITLRFSFD